MLFGGRKAREGQTAGDVVDKIEKALKSGKGEDGVVIIVKFNDRIIRDREAIRVLPPRKESFRVLGIKKGSQQTYILAESLNGSNKRVSIGSGTEITAV